MLVAKFNKGINVDNDVPKTINMNIPKEMLGIGINLAYKLVRIKTTSSHKVGREYKIPI